MNNAKIEWKNLGIIFLLIVMVTFITACQPTPNIQTIIGTNSSVMEQILSQQENIQHPFVEIDTPKQVITEEKEYGKMNLKFEADIIVPDTSAYPVTEVTKRAFSDEVINSLIKRFAGSDYEMYSQWNLTKKEWLDKQIEYKKNDPERKLAPNYLDYLHQMYVEADEKIQNPLIKISGLPKELPSQVFVKQENNNVAYFIFSRNGNNFTYIRDIAMEQAPASIYKDEFFDEKNETIEQFQWRQSKEPEITQEEAYEKALKYLNELKIDLELYKAETCTFLENVVNKSVGWNFIFTRKLANAQSRYDLNGFSIDKKAMPSYGAPWDVEVCTIGIDKNGLCFLEYKGASQISKEIQNTTELEQFDIIQQRIANQLNYIYGATTRDNGIGLDIKISKIELGTSLISVKNETDTGVYIPTWYVDYYIKWSDAENSNKNWELSTIIFNAIDGSYIEPRATNEKLMNILSIKE